MNELTAVKRNRAFAASPRVLEQFPELARSAQPQPEFTIAPLVEKNAAVQIDYDAHTITLAPPKGDDLVFVWKESTRFSQGWSRICLGALEAGQSVRVYYRREIGQFVPRDMNLRTETPTRCTTGGCCAKRS